MPFTFSHPAIVLPLTLLPKRWISATGLIAGSMAPDFEYFLRMRVHSEYSHTLWGLLWYCMPLGLVMGFVFHAIVKRTLINNLPAVLQARFRKFADVDWTAYCKENWPIVLLSVLAGAGSHVLWDSFTHEHGYFVLAWPVLTEKPAIGQMYLPVYKLLQHGSTLAGFTMILIFVKMIPADYQLVRKIEIRYWLLVLSCTMVILAARLLSGLEPKAYGSLVVTLIAAFLLGLILTPLMRAFKFRNNS